MSLHVPEVGSPLRTTLPVETVYVGCVIVPTTGAEGVGGCEFIMTFDDTRDVQPDSSLTVKLYVPVGSPVTVVIVPVPVVVIPPA